MSMMRQELLSCDSVASAVDWRERASLGHELNQALDALEREKGARAARKHPLVAVELTADELKYRELPSLELVAPSGSVAFLWGKRGGALLSEAYAAFSSGNWAQIESYCERVVQHHALQRRRSNIANYVRDVVDRGTLVDLCYDGSPLGASVGLPEGADLAVTAFPWNGESLDRECFSLIEFPPAKGACSLAGLAVMRPPVRTAAELIAESLLPAEGYAPADVTNGIGHIGSSVVIATVVCTPTLVVHANTYDTTGGDPPLAGAFWKVWGSAGRRSQGVGEEFDPQGSIAELMQARRQLISVAD